MQNSSKGSSSGTLGTLVPAQATVTQAFLEHLCQNLILGRE